jgi:predicted transcriptional regulator
VTIRGFIEKYKMSIEEFSKKCGVPRATVYRHLNGEVEPRFGALQRYIDASKGEITASEVFGEYIAARDARAAKDSVA